MRLIKIDMRHCQEEKRNLLFRIHHQSPVFDARCSIFFPDIVRIYFFVVRGPSSERMLLRALLKKLKLLVRA